jgi:hypothetical protein
VNCVVVWLVDLGSNSRVMLYADDHMLLPEAVNVVIIQYLLK